MYDWRRMTEQQRGNALESRMVRGLPPHSPPHYETEGQQTFHLSAANFDHQAIIGATLSRMAEFTTTLCSLFDACRCELFAWCVLPNHWHALISTDGLKPVLHAIGQMHGRTSFEWNRDEEQRGRQCWHCCADRRTRSEAHFHATRNYIHHNPVKHGYTQRWQDWPFSSAADFLRDTGREDAERLWRDFPILKMGEKWD